MSQQQEAVNKKKEKKKRRGIVEFLPRLKERRMLTLECLE